MAVAEHTTYPNILKYGLQASYNALATKDATVLYFCTDTKKIYKGDIDFTDSVVYSTQNSDVTAPIIGKLYVFSTTGTCEVYNGTSWTVVSYPLVTTIGLGANDVSVPSTKAVKDYVDANMTGTDIVKSINQKMTSDAEPQPVRGTFEYTTGDDVKHDVQLTGVVTKPSFDATTRTFTFPVAGESDVTVELGTDIFIDPTANNRYENGNIYLYLNDGAGGSGRTEPTELVIPVTGLITDYFGDDTDSIQVDINNSTHKVTAQAILRPDVAGSFTNALKVSSTAGAVGLYVDFSDLEADIADLQADIDRIDGDANTEGSILYKIKAYDDTTGAAMRTDIATLDSNMAALAQATTVWGTF
jgi:hypothetical protein